MEHLEFFYTLRSYGVPVSVKYILDYHSALQKGLGGSLDRAYRILRLICIKRLEHIDAFERAFAKYFLDLSIPAAQEPIEMETLLESTPFREWLGGYLKDLNMDISRILHQQSPEELLQKFLETISRQKEAHHGGGKWIGTNGYSPWGHSGFAQRGFRVLGESHNRSAIKVLGERRYADFSVKSELKQENIRQVLGSLKQMVSAGPKTDIDIDETIRKTAKNNGEIELEFKPEIRDKIKVILLIDNGGYSMDRFLPLVRILFSKMLDRFKNIRTFFFHNCIYDRIYLDPQRRRPQDTEKLLMESQHTRLFIIGDSAMAPEELMQSGGSISWYETDHQPGIHCLQMLKNHFPYSVWLNPIPREHWRSAWGAYTIHKVAEIFHMEDMTLSGIKNAVEYLSHQKAYKPY